MRWWHRWRHGSPTLGIVYPSRSDWVPRLLVVQDVICPCGRSWQDQFIVLDREDKWIPRTVAMLKFW